MYLYLHFEITFADLSETLLPETKLTARCDRHDTLHYSFVTVSIDQWARAGLVVFKVTHHNLMSTYYVSMPTWQTVFPGRGL